MLKKSARSTTKRASGRKDKKLRKQRVVKVGSSKAAKMAQVKAPTERLEKGYTKADLEHFKQIILERRKDIVEELDMLRESMVDTTTGEYVGENSSYSLHMEQGTDTMEREKLFLMAAREQKFLNYLDDALLRIEKGTYGMCIECGNPIERERLEAVPHTQLCSKCKARKGTT
ncbi:MAG: TraR/DksA family transcriptional regulator [Bacteroidota bacterium]